MSSGIVRPRLIKMFVLETPISWTTCWYTPFSLEHNAYAIHTICYLSPYHLTDSSFQANPTRIALGNPKSCKLFSYLMILVKPSYFSILFSQITTHSSPFQDFFHTFFLVLLVVRNRYPAPKQPTPPGHKECQ